MTKWQSAPPRRRKSGNQGFNINVTVPPFGKGKLVIGLIFYDTAQLGKRFFNEERSGVSYYENVPVKGKDHPPGSGPQAITHNWGIGLTDIPREAVSADVRLWFDPYGDGTTLLPTGNGLLLTVHRGESAHAESL